MADSSLQLRVLFEILKKPSHSSSSIIFSKRIVTMEIDFIS